MTEPRRLLEDDTDPLQQQLLAVGRSYRASSRTRARTAAALGLSLVPVLATSKASAATQFASPLAKIATVGLVASSTSFLAYQVFVSRDTVESPAPLVTISDPIPPRAALAEPEAEKPTEPAEASVEVPSEPPRVTSTSQAPVVRSNPGSTDALSVELARLDGARKKLAAGQATAALEALDAYGREFPRGSLRLEASVLRIEALAKAGRTSEARDRAKRFLAAHPNSVLAARVKRYAGE
jgi:hypothetical protein